MKFWSFEWKLQEKKLVVDNNEARCFSIILDKTMDIAGTKQLSLFMHVSSNYVLRKVFIGFGPLYDLTGGVIDECAQKGLNLENLVGQGLDGASSMAGKVIAV